MLKTLIIDSHSDHQQALEQLLLTYPQPLEIVGQATDIVSGIHKIHQLEPDLVLLDTEMPYYSGFKLLDFFKTATFHIIFTTLSKEHALKALKANALAYLIKPIQQDLLYKAVDKAISLQQSENSNTATLAEKKIAFPSTNGWLYFYQKEIVFLESKGKNTLIHLINGTTFSTIFGLKECQLLLEKTNLFRVHRSYMVNLQLVKRYMKGRESLITLKDDTEVDVGKMYKEDLNKIVSFFPK